MMKKMMEKLFDHLRFVFITSFVLCFSLFFLDYMAVHHGQSGITFLLIPNQVQGPNSGQTLNFSGKNTTTSDISVPDFPTSGVSDMQTDTITENENPLEIQEHDWYDPCSGKYIYMHDIPSRFNEDLLERCHRLLKWMNMCPSLTNLGLGPKIMLTERSKTQVLSLKNRWYATNQFSLEVIFHNKMKHYRCLTNNSSSASAVFVPYYAGLDVGQYLWDTNVSVRDASPIELSNWLSSRPEWKRMRGRDHFLVGGRIGWDFRRRTENDSDWGTKLMFLPQFSNMTFLPIESGSYPNDFPIPYPTYFHPLKDHEILKWQKRMRKVKRPYLFSFVGATRPNSTQLLRNELIKQCLVSSKACNFLSCYDGKGNPCEDPVSITKVFQSSHFCLQPPGDSYTRRSTFDSILAGCVPVFFHPSSAYDQYLWHLPKDGSKYSVFVPEEDVKEKGVMISDALLRFSKSEVMALREEVIKLIPRIIYGDPKSRFETIEDAFDIAVKEILKRVENVRREIFNVNT
ncbi:hypothetical protein QN277_027461 [Acacia crassicarpa]|uniref:Exostosin GT47 domain-containing protein n=1 Tax=Acacia crassicarpa TaxID=499986 RepID=A0AAE1JEG7_9FABA|nr:hypothetical protein QN277_027461 [Acacia crassicarpa]